MIICKINRTIPKINGIISRGKKFKPSLFPLENHKNGTKTKIHEIEKNIIARFWSSIGVSSGNISGIALAIRKNNDQAVVNRICGPIGCNLCRIHPLPPIFGLVKSQDTGGFFSSNLVML
jgi:hypothetical protein